MYKHFTTSLNYSYMNCSLIYPIASLGRLAIVITPRYSGYLFSLDFSAQ